MARLALGAPLASPSFNELKRDAQQGLRFFGQLQVFAGRRRAQTYAVPGIPEDHDLSAFAANTYVVPAGMFSARDRGPVS
jgi:hypothetical protein